MAFMEGVSSRQGCPLRGVPLYTVQGYVQSRAYKERGHATPILIV